MRMPLIVCSLYVRMYDDGLCILTLQKSEKRKKNRVVTNYHQFCRRRRRLHRCCRSSVARENLHRCLKLWWDTNQHFFFISLDPRRKWQNMIRPWQNISTTFDRHDSKRASRTITATTHLKKKTAERHRSNDKRQEREKLRCTFRVLFTAITWYSPPG